MQIIRRVVAKISIGMAGTDWKFFRTLSISGGGGGGKETTRRAVSMANFSRVQDLTDRTIHEYTRGGYRR